MKYLLSGILFFYIIGSDGIQAQDYDSWRMGLIANPQYPYGSDVWGYTDENGHDFAVFGAYDGTVILDVSTNPSNPIETGYIPGNGSSWRDLKTHGDYLYVSNESGGGLDIIDLTDPWHPFLAGHYTQTFTTAHNLFITDGYAYIVGANTGSGGIRILDLADPVSPVEVGSWEMAYIHDIYVKNDTAYCSGIYTDKLYILDVSDKTSISILAVIPNIPWSHSNWVSNDSKYLFSASETQGGHIIIFDIQDFSNINVLSHFEVGSGKTVHNVFIKDDRMFLSYYIFGTRVVDISNPSNPVEVAYFDNYPESNGFFDGNWGTYPFTNSGLIYSTSMSGQGFFILQYPMYVEFIHEPLTDTEDAEGPYDVSITINPLEGNMLMDGTAMAVSGLNGVFTDTTYLTAGTGVGEYVASLPGHGGESGVFMYYFSVLDTAGRWSTKPFGAPEFHYSFNVGPDFILPLIHFIIPSGEIGFIRSSGSLRIATGVSDNIGIEAVSILYSVNGSDFVEIHMDSISFETGHELYEGYITWQDVPIPSEIQYFVKCWDASLQSNMAVSNFNSFDIGYYEMVDDFEKGLGKWDVGDGWGTSVFGFEQSKAAHDSPDGKYENNTYNSLTLGVSYNLSPYDSAFLSFKHMYFTWPNQDSCLVLISQDSVDWEILAAYSGWQGILLDEYIDLSAWMGVGSETTYLRFTLMSDGTQTADGWHIDNIELHTVPGILSNEDMISELPSSPYLNQNYPNPFNPVTTIQFGLHEAGKVELVIYDILGREVKTLVSSRQVTGQHSIVWDSSNVGSGVYFYRLVVRQDGILSYTETKKLIVLK